MSCKNYKYKVKVTKSGAIGILYAMEVKHMNENTCVLTGVIEKGTPNGYEVYPQVTIPMKDIIIMELEEPYCEKDIMPGA